MALVVLATLVLVAAAVTGYFGYARPEARGASLAQMLTAGLLTLFAGAICLAFYYGSADWTIRESGKASGDAVAAHIPGAAARVFSSDAAARVSAAHPSASADFHEQTHK